MPGSISIGKNIWQFFCWLEKNQKDVMLKIYDAEKLPIVQLWDLFSTGCKTSDITSIKIQIVIGYKKYKLRPIFRTLAPLLYYVCLFMQIYGVGTYWNKN